MAETLSWIVTIEKVVHILGNIIYEIGQHGHHFLLQHYRIWEADTKSLTYTFVVAIVTNIGPAME
jgi:hypothetical protein